MVLPGIALYRPTLRSVYWLDRAAYNPRDPKTERPAVIVAMREKAGFADVVTRTTSDKHNGDVPHGADRALGLSRPGWWQPTYRYYEVPSAWFDEPDVTPAGKLDQRTFDLVLAAWTGRTR